MRKNVLIAGKAGSGKDTVGDWLIEHYGYQRVSFAEPMKRLGPVLWPHLDWSQKQRVTLQKFGSVIRSVDPDTWVRLAWMRTEELNSLGTPVVLTDCRYPNELDFFGVRGAAAIRVEASYVTRVHRLTARDGSCDEEALKHISETSLDGLGVPVLDNNGTIAELFAGARDLLSLD